MEYSADKSEIKRREVNWYAREYYRRNREKLLENQKLYESEKRKRRTEEEKEKLKKYNAEYYIQMLRDGRRTRQFINQGKQKRKPKEKTVKEPVKNSAEKMEMTRLEETKKVDVFIRSNGDFVLCFD